MSKKTKAGKYELRKTRIRELNRDEVYRYVLERAIEVGIRYGVSPFAAFNTSCKTQQKAWAIEDIIGNLRELCWVRPGRGGLMAIFGTKGELPQDEHGKWSIISYPEITALFGWRNHTTVLLAHKRYLARQEAVKREQTLGQEIIEYLTGHCDSLERGD